jgi:Ion channel/Pentapeptide repeats (8 copies)
MSAVDYNPDLTSEYVTGDQSLRFRQRRGALRPPAWQDVETWRSRWNAPAVTEVLRLLGECAPASAFAELTGFQSIRTLDARGREKTVPDLRGLDLALLPPEMRQILYATPARPDLSYARLEGARLTDLNLDGVNLERANLRKATLRRTNLNGADLGKAHLEDADLRDATLDNANLGHIRYTEDGFWWRGTVLMETHLNRARYVDPLLDRCARDQYYLYVLKYRHRNNPMFRIFMFLWWLTANYGKSVFLWAGWVATAILFFSLMYLPLETSYKHELPWTFATCLYFSVVTFTTLGYGDIVPTTETAAWIVTGEALTGYLMLGGLVSIIASKIATRA